MSLVFMSLVFSVHYWMLHYFNLDCSSEVVTVVTLYLLSIGYKHHHIQIFAIVLQKPPNCPCNQTMKFRSHTQHICLAGITDCNVRSFVSRVTSPTGVEDTEGHGSQMSGSGNNGKVNKVRCKIARKVTVHGPYHEVCNN